MGIAFPLLDFYLFIFNVYFCGAEDATCPLLQSSLSSFTAFFPQCDYPKAGQFSTALTTLSSVTLRPVQWLSKGEHLSPSLTTWVQSPPSAQWKESLSYMWSPGLHVCL